MNPHMVRQAAPLSPQLLNKMHDLLDFNRPVDAVLWALFVACLLHSFTEIQPGGDQF